MDAADIVAAVNIEDYVSQYTDLEEKGGELWGISPFNTDEKTPSFSLDLQKRCFYDFSAGFGGNLVDFVMAHDHCTVGQAINKLKQFAHITEDKEGNPVQRLSVVSIAKRYRSDKRAPPKCTAKILPDNYMERYEFRKDKLQVWADEGIPFDVMWNYQIRYDAFDDRIVYPIRNLNGEIFCVSGRTCDPDYKAKGLRKYTYTSPIGALPTMYGFWENREAIMESKEAIVFEGCKSVLKSVSFGYPNAVALLTSHLSPFQLETMIKLASFHSIRFVFALDSDVDLSKDKNIMRLRQYARVEWIRNVRDMLGEKEAPVDRGKEVFEQLYKMRKKLS